MKVSKSKIIKISIIIVYYGESESLLSLVKSIRRTGFKTRNEIIVVNNKPTDKVAVKLKKISRKIKYIESPANIGYGSGNNIGAKIAKAKYMLIVNPDVILKSNTINTLTDFLDKNEDAAIVAPNFTYIDGQFIEYIGSRTLTPLRGAVALSLINKLWPDNPISRRYYLKDMDINQVREVDVAPGTCFLIRKSVFDDLRGFDPNFFLFFEETDLCKRVRESGWKIFITPKTSVSHDWKPGEGSKTLNNHYKASRFYYFKKHYGILPAIIVELTNNFSKWHLMLVLLFGILIFLKLLE